MAARRYAERTEVSIEQSIADIRAVVARYEGAQFVYMLGEDEALIAFTKEARQVRFYVSLKDRDAQSRKVAMRALLLVIKAKLEAVASGIVLFEDEFLANVVLPDGNLVGREVRERLAHAYETREMPKLLPDYTQ